MSYYYKNRLKNIGPATAGSAGPVPAPLLYSRCCHFKKNFSNFCKMTNNIIVDIVNYLMLLQANS